MASSADCDPANDLRLRGNHEFSQGNYEHAKALYTAALESIAVVSSTASSRSADSGSTSTGAAPPPPVSIATTTPTAESKDSKNDGEVNVGGGVGEAAAVILYCNRSACCYQLGDHDGSIRDAERAWQLSAHTSIKAAYRLAKSALASQRYGVVKTTVAAALRILQDHELIIVADPSKPAMPDRRQRGAENATTTTTTTATTTSNDNNNNGDDIAQQRASFQELLKSALLAEHVSIDDTTGPETSILHATRPVSIREFETVRELGHGNFSEIYHVKHKVTGEVFALKKINKKAAADLYKRQHPNVYNEIQMERRCLLERIRDVRYVVPMYHAFQDYENLYYLMQLQDTDLWSQLRYKNLPGYGETIGSPGETLIMMGCHRSPAKRWIRQVVDALEAIHRLGIVHRDLKAENVLLDQHHNVVVIDFGTAKDLVLTDLNGPEFVGTPDFMSVEAVSEDGAPAGPTADLWALGCLTFVLQTGHTPYWSPSPYLAFLKIKRARKYFNVPRPGGIMDDDCWNFISALMHGDPTRRLGYTADYKNVNYDCLRDHPYLADAETTASFLPTLWDLAVRACAEMAYQDSLDIDLCEAHPPGDGSKHDLVRLGPHERAAVLHCLDRRRLLAEYRLYRRFFSSPPDRVRQYDVVGLTQMNDDQGKPDQTHDPYSKHKSFVPIRIAQVVSPILLQQADHSSGDDDIKKRMMKLFKRCIAAVNRSRPDLVVVAGSITPSLRKVLSKVSDSIPVVAHDGKKDFTFWKRGVQCIAVASHGCNEDWLQQELEIATMSKHPLFVYTAAAPHTLGVSLLDSMAAGRTHGLFGIAEQSSDSTVEAKSDPDNDKVDEDWKMKVHSSGDNGIYTVTVLEEPDQWSSDFEVVDVP